MKILKMENFKLGLIKQGLNLDNVYPSINLSSKKKKKLKKYALCQHSMQFDHLVN